MKFEKIKYIERKTGEIKTEKVMGEGALKFLYYNPFGKLALHTIVKRKFLSDWYGRKMSKPESKEKIKSFVEEMGIDMNEYKRPIEDYTSFNDFFYRELKDGARKIDYNENVVVSPADGKILAFENIKEVDTFFVKGSEFTLEEFFNDKELAKKYKDGTFVIIRLAPADYHRFHFPVDGEISEVKKISGDYYSVSTHAIKTNFRIFCENKREYAILKTKKFGDIAMFDIGATMVGAIVQTYKANSFVKKGEEKGYFLFGGSTCILIFEKGKVIIDKDIIENTQNKIETRIYMGEKFGNEKTKYFKIGDLVIYIFLLIFFSILIFKIGSFKDVKGAKAEIWVDGELKYVYPLQEEEKNIFVDTNLGGCNVQFKDNMVRVTTSNSPLKIAVKQGFIKSPGEVIIGIPDRLVIKVVGDSENDSDVDFIAR